MESCCTDGAFYECTGSVKEDGKVFAVWWLTILVLDCAVFRFASIFFRFRDRDICGKDIRYCRCGIFDVAGSKYGNCTVYACGCLVLSTGVLAAVCWGVWIALKKQKIKDKTSWKFKQNGTRQC